MKMSPFCSSLLVTLVTMVVVAASGCNQQDAKPSAQSKPEASSPAAGHEQHDEHDHAVTTDNHSGWWCSEHGVPEEVCSQCSSKAAKQFKADGDWCQEHNRAESQCFICVPTRAEKFAKLYVAKFGKQPPKVSE